MNEITVTDQSGIRRIGLDRPAKRNALTRAMYWAFAEALAGAPAARARVVLIHGSEACFTGGNDLADFAGAVPGERSAASDFLEALLACEIPLVACVNGAAVGVGTTMLLHCDLVYCSAAARFQLPFVNLGLCPEAASSFLLPARAGLLRANEMLMLGDPFDAETARQAGIVNTVLPTPAAAAAHAAARADALAAKPPEALRTTRALLRRHGQAAADAMRQEGLEFTRLLHGPEAREALAARRENRAPDWQAATLAAE